MRVLKSAVLPAVVVLMGAVAADVAGAQSVTVPATHAGRDLRREHRDLVRDKKEARTDVRDLNDVKADRRDAVKDTRDIRRDRRAIRDSLKP